MRQPLIASLSAAAGGMTPALGRIAQAVLAEPEATLTQSITELAEASGSSEASVIRFCRGQGLAGYGAFKLSLAQELAARPRDDAGEPGDEAVRLVETVVTALRETERLIDRGAIATVATRLLAAGSVECFGIAASAVTAQSLAYKLSRIGRPSRALSDAHLAIMAAETAGPGSVHVVVSSSGGTTDAVRVAERAPERQLRGGPLAPLRGPRGGGPRRGADRLLARDAAHRGGLPVQDQPAPDRRRPRGRDGAAGPRAARLRGPHRRERQ